MEGNRVTGLGDLHVDSFGGTVLCVPHQDMELSGLLPGKLVALSPGDLWQYLGLFVMVTTVI